MTNNDYLHVTYRKRTFIISKCHHEAGAFTEGCLGCAPNWGWSCIEYVEKRQPFGGSRHRPSRLTNDKVMRLPEVLAFTGQK